MKLEETANKLSFSTSEEPVAEASVRSSSQEKLLKENQDLKNEVIELEHRLCVLEDEQKDNTIECYDEYKRKFTTEFQKCVHNLLNENIPTNRVSPCIGHVLHFAGIEPNKLPSPTTIRTMNAQRLVLAHLLLK